MFTRAIHFEALHQIVKSTTKERINDRHGTLMLRNKIVCRLPVLQNPQPDQLDICSNALYGSKPNWEKQDQQPNQHLLSIKGSK